jgi:hypothetical protein
MWSVDNDGPLSAGVNGIPGINSILRQYNTFAKNEVKKVECIYCERRFRFFRPLATT